MEAASRNDNTEEGGRHYVGQKDEDTSKESRLEVVYSCFQLVGLPSYLPSRTV